MNSAENWETYSIKFLDFDKIFQRVGAVWLNERCDILREDVEGQRTVR